MLAVPHAICSRPSLHVTHDPPGVDRTPNPTLGVPCVHEAPRACTCVCAAPLCFGAAPHTGSSLRSLVTPSTDSASPPWAPSPLLLARGAARAEVRRAAARTGLCAATRTVLPRRRAAPRQRATAPPPRRSRATGCIFSGCPAVCEGARLCSHCRIPCACVTCGWPRKSSSERSPRQKEQSREDDDEVETLTP